MENERVEELKHGYMEHGYMEHSQNERGFEIRTPH